MTEEQDLQLEINKVSESIRSLENLRGKIPDQQLQSSLAVYQKRLQMLVAKLKSTSPSAPTTPQVRPQRETVQAEETKRIPLTTTAKRDGYAIYLSAAGNASLDEGAFANFLSQYLTWLRSSYGLTRLYGLETLHEDGSKFVRPLHDMYLQPTLRIFSAKQQEEAMNQSAGKSSRAARARAHLEVVDRVNSEGKDLPFVELLATGKRLAIVGGAGSGKTTLLAYLSVLLAAYAQNGSFVTFNLPQDATTLLPFLIPLRYFWRYKRAFEKDQQRQQKEAILKRAQQDAAQKTNAQEGEHQPQVEKPSPEKDSLNGTLAGYILVYLKQITPAFRFSNDFFERLLNSGKCLFLLDGLDEYSGGELRSDARHQLQAFLHQFPDTQVLVTARDSGCLEDAFFDEKFTLIHLQPFDSQQMDRFILNWCNQFNPRKAGSLSRDIRSAVEELNQICVQGRLSPLIGTPLMAQAVISLRLGNPEFPRSPAWFYEKIIQMILQMQAIPDDPARSETIDWGGDRTNLLNWYSTLAVEMQKGGYEGSAIVESQLREILADDIPEEKQDGFVEAVRFRGVLVEERTEVFHFLHPILRRYLVSRKILVDKDKILPDLEYMAPRPEWREIILQVYQLARGQDAEFAARYLEWLMGLDLPGIELAGAALLDGSDLEEGKRTYVANKLIAALSDKSCGALPPQRLLAGNTLARLGDLRFNKERWFLPDEPLLGFVKIPAGNYMIGANPETDPEALTKESPLHELSIPAFYIARYPTTVAQYRIFTEETGYTPASKEWGNKLSNHPVVNLSWDDAMAYCQWLEKKLTYSDLAPEELSELLKTTDWEVNLPSEPEWEAAARGATRRVFPWGSKFDPRRANTVETRLGSTTSVGIFSGGESPFHVLDLSGNIWEWTRSLYRIYYYDSDDGREDNQNRDDFRVMRGGSYLDTNQQARCPFRSVFYPYHRGPNIGFRVVLYQKYTYEEKEVEVEVELEEGEVAQDGRTTRWEKQKILERKRLVVTGPKMDR